MADWDCFNILMICPFVRKRGSSVQAIDIADITALAEVTPDVRQAPEVASQVGKVTNYRVPV